MDHDPTNGKVITNCVFPFILVYDQYPREKEDYELQLADSPISIGKSNDYVALVTLKEYYNFITGGSDFLDQSIFEANIRDYQGDVSVNTQIRNTLEQKTSQKNIDFWWLNNGITILAKKVMPQTGKSLLVIEPEIVNGLQTSNEIYNYFSENPDKISKDTRNILVRIIVPDNEQLRDDIILATNNQTQIPKSSLRVSDPIHWQIEMYFKSKGLYYDRRKNHYKNLGKKSTEIISVSYLGVTAKFCVIFSGVDMEPLAARYASLAAALKNRAGSQSGYHTALSM